MAVWRKEVAVKRFILLLALIALTGCETRDVIHEIGYKGKARVNPWLAAERFSKSYAREVHSWFGWKTPSASQQVWIVPAMILNNQSFTQQIERWVTAGGHLVLLIDHADTHTNDWNQSGSAYEPNAALETLLIKSDLVIKARHHADADEIRYRGTVYDVNASAETAVAFRDKEPGVFASTRTGQGRISVLTDGRLFRNRWIGENDHAALLADLIGKGERPDSVVFIRGSVLSLWALLGTYLPALLIALGALLCLWLWKNFARFGPLESEAEVSTLRGYDHHLEALGDFQWRLDGCQTLLAPLRFRLTERGQQLGARSGQQHGDLFQLLADHSGLPRDRVMRAMSDQAPADAAGFTRIMTDLQVLNKVLS
jgi:hypothetical protein